MLPPSRQRVARRTSPELARRIREASERSIAEAARGGGQAVDQRIERLEQEWDVERALQANAAGFALAGLALGLRWDRRFLAIPALVAAFLLQHALHGWCPPLPLLRRLGFRTVPEIDRERYALKALRGDFCAIRPGRPEAAGRALDAAR